MNAARKLINECCQELITIFQTSLYKGTYRKIICSYIKKEFVMHMNHLVNMHRFLRTAREVYMYIRFWESSEIMAVLATKLYTFFVWKCFIYFLCLGDLECNTFEQRYGWMRVWLFDSHPSIQNGISTNICISLHSRQCLWGRGKPRSRHCYVDT